MATFGLKQLDLGEFDCKRCNRCCEQPGFVYLSEKDVKRAAEFLEIDIYEFTARFSNLRDRKRLVLKKKMSEACVFLAESGCLIHAAKPEQCTDFPTKWRTERSLHYCEGLQLVKGKI